jgi:hypothetical protein
MGKIIDMPKKGNLTEAEISELHETYPDLKRLLGNTYELRKVHDYIYVTNNKDVELGVGLFVTISRTNNL